MVRIRSNDLYKLRYISCRYLLLYAEFGLKNTKLYYTKSNVLNSALLLRPLSDI